MRVSPSASVILARSRIHTRCACFRCAFARRVSYGASAGSCAISCAGCVGLILILVVIFVVLIAFVVGAVSGGPPST